MSDRSGLVPARRLLQAVGADPSGIGQRALLAQGSSVRLRSRGVRGRVLVAGDCRPRVQGTAALGTAALMAALSACAFQPAAPPFSGDGGRVPIASAYGSGNFGSWMVDRWGLPAYDYQIDQNTDPIAIQSALNGSRDAWNAVANAHDKVDAHTDGRMEFWSQDRLSEWANATGPAARHYTGGWGYLRVGGKTTSTGFDDLQPGMSQDRQFGVGYFHRRTGASPVSIDEYVYAPFGDAPLVLHDVTLLNSSRSAIMASWWEYWDVNPVALATSTGISASGAAYQLGITRVHYDAARRALVADQDAGALDPQPLSVFASALDTPITGYEASTQAFFGRGTRAEPEAVAAGHAGDTLASPSLPGQTGTALFALQAPVTLAPGATVTLRFAYGMAHPDEIAGLVDRFAHERDPLTTSMASWRAYVPQVSLGPQYAWLSREIQWDAYLVKSNERYEELCHTHVITQGGYYQYAWGYNLTYRDPLEHQLGIMLIDPQAARETLVWALQYQPASTGDLPYATSPMCKANGSWGTADELNFYLMLGVIQYVENTNDTAFLDQQVPFYGGGTGTVWEHLKLAYRNQETAVGYGSHGSYLSGTEGDTFDLTTDLVGMQESISATGYFAYVYPQLAGLARWKGDAGFASELEATAAKLDTVMRREWQPRGWFARGYTLGGKIGVGTIYGDAQYWPLAAGIPTTVQARQLMANVQRYLDGIGAPSQLAGPSLLGPMELPSRNDPVPSEAASAAWPGRDMWWFVDGQAVWALVQRAHDLPGSAAYAWSIFTRLTLASHATHYPDDWSGVISADDTCANYSAPDPGQCGIATIGANLQAGYSTQITHAPAYALFDLVKIAGIEATPGGYTIDPQLPMHSFSLRLATLGLEYGPGRVRGYLRPIGDGVLAFSVRIPDGIKDPLVSVNGHRAPATLEGRFVRFVLPGQAGETVNWSISGS